MSDFDRWTTGGAVALDRYAPSAGAALRHLAAVRPSGVSPDLNAALRSTAAGANVLPALGGATRPPDADPAITLFAEQFAIDVSSLDDRRRQAFAAACGPSLFGTVQMIYVADFVPRTFAALDAVFGASQWTVLDAAPVDDTWPAVEAFIDEVAKLSALGPLPTELIRLRGARQHDCRLCRSRRSLAAAEGGADEATFDAVDRYRESDLPESVKAALELTDAIVWQPSSIGADTVSDIHRWFEPAEALEIVLDVTRNAANKIAVALGADAPVVTEGVEWFATDDDGRIVTEGLNPRTQAG